MPGARRLIPLGAFLFAVGCGNPRPNEQGKACPEAPPETASGELRGIEDDGTCAYLGVPYALPPVGDLRWRAPVPIDRRNERVLADSLGAPCVQVDFQGTVSGNEDCLTLNIWVPPHGDSQLPVLVFFHGGGNVMGSAADPSYDGALLATRLRALVVSIQFRIGALGYLVHPALSAENVHGVSGNYGLLDQIEALTWIEQNAPQFAADPSQVTVLGQSAGARNICALLASPSASGLFHAAILHSGACNAREYADSELYGIQLSEALGCELDARPALCLRRKSAAEVTTTYPSLPDPMTISAYNPTVDGFILPAPPLEGLVPAVVAGRPVIVGSNADETALVTPRIESEDEYRTLLNADFGEDLADTVLEHYPIRDYGSATQALVAAVSDTRYACAARQTVRAVSSSGSAAYRFWFSHRPSNPPYHAYGATHALELMYLFGTYPAYDYEPSDEDRRIASEWLRFYSNFIHDADPGTVGDRTWLPEADAPGYVLRIGEARSVSDQKRDELCDFWESLKRD